jgi:hypothetical protein
MVKRVVRILTWAAALTLAVGNADAASLSLRRAADGATSWSAQVGEVVDLEVALDTGTEAVTGIAVYVSYPADVFRLLPAGADGSQAPFSGGPLLHGIELVNRSLQVGDEVWLDYSEAVGQSDPRGVVGAGAVARFRLEVLRRPAAGPALIQLDNRGHDRSCHYVVASAPGTEQRFPLPLAQASVRVTGFRLQPLPDVVLIAGESRVVFDLDAFVDTTAGQVLWTHSQLTEVPTRTDPGTHAVSMSPPAGQVGHWSMVFTAFEPTEGLTAADTIDIRILSPPRITATMPETLRFAEDTAYRELDLDAAVEDVDSPPAQLTWEAVPVGGLVASIDANSHILALAAPPDWFGSASVLLVVTDPSGLRDSARVAVAVAPVNDPPEMRQHVPVYPVVGGAVVDVPLAALLADRDDPLANLAIEVVAEAGVQAQIQGEALRLRGVTVGRALVRLTAADTSGAAVATRQVAVALAAGSVLAPQIDRLPVACVYGGRTTAVDLTPWVWDDRPLSELRWEAAAGPGLTAGVRDGVVQVAGRTGFVGLDQVALVAVDRDGNRGLGQLQVQVLRAEDDLGPRVYDPGKIGLRTADSSVVLPLDRWVSDPDDAPAQITWTVQPSAGLAYDAATRRLRLLPGVAWAEPAAVSLTARDPAGHTHQVTVPVLVAAPGRPPQLRDFPQVSLDSLNLPVELDLDEFAWDDQDSEAELVWSVVAEPGVAAAVDPVSHRLVLARQEVTGTPPLVTQVLIRATDTNGLATTRLLQVGLPPLFSLASLPEVALIAGRTDSSLVLDDYVRHAPAGLVLNWTATSGVHVTATVSGPGHRLRLGAADASFEGTETLTLRATDPTGRSLSTTVRVVVRGRGLVPQLRSLPAQTLQQGQEGVLVPLDDYVIDDDPDSVLVWSVSGQQTVQAAIDPRSHRLTLGARTAALGQEVVQLLVRDPAGNVAVGALTVVVVRGGAAPVVGPLPQMVLAAGGAAGQLDLSLFAQDPDTPLAQLTWQAAAAPGLALQLQGSVLTLSVPVGGRGTRLATVTATDPQGNVGQAQLWVLVEGDEQPPALSLAVVRHPVFAAVLRVTIAASEPLAGLPSVRVDTTAVAVEALGGNRYAATFSFAPQAAARVAEIFVEATDAAGNVARRRLAVSMGWMDRQGGVLAAPEPQVLLHVGDAAAGPGHLALLYRLAAEDLPDGSGDQPVFAVDLLRGRPLARPVTVNFFVGQEADTTWGIQRWDPARAVWTDLPTWVDGSRGWRSAVVDTLGLFRAAPVAAAARHETAAVRAYPNPARATAGGRMQLVYQVSLPGPVRLEVFDVLGQPVRTLADGFADVGTWSVPWDGYDASGVPVAAGVYLYRLTEAGRQHHGRLLWVR